MPGRVIDGAALAVTTGGLVAAVLVLAATRQPPLALKVLLDFLLAAGLLRLTGQPDWSALASTAAVVAVRRLVGAGLRTGSGPAGLLGGPAVTRLLLPARRGPRDRARGSLRGRRRSR